MKEVAGFIELTFGEDKAVRCGCKTCKNFITKGQRCYYDTEEINPLGRHVFCSLCGPAERYTRKKALQRGEPIPDIGSATEGFY